MRSVGMLRGRSGAACLLVLAIGCANSLPLQLLPDIPGYIPVYIRHGDEPLEEINPDLAEAFHETQSHPKIARQVRMPEDLEIALSSEEDEEEEKMAPVLKSLVANGLHDERNEMLAQRLNRRKPIEVPKNSVLKEAGISEAEERELVKLAAEIEREETKPNDLYDTHASNPLYSGQGRVEMRDSMKGFKPLSKWALVESSETANDPKEEFAEDSSSKETGGSEEKEYKASFDKAIEESIESDSNVPFKDFESGERTKERKSDSEENDE